VAIMLLNAGVALQREAWVEEATSLLKRNARGEMREAGVADASLCHGALGIAHLYSVGYGITKSSTLLTMRSKIATCGDA
jgi:class I lanthipeptide synthase